MHVHTRTCTRIHKRSLAHTAHLQLIRGEATANLAEKHCLHSSCVGQMVHGHLADKHLGVYRHIRRPVIYMNNTYTTDMASHPIIEPLSSPPLSRSLFPSLSLYFFLTASSSLHFQQAKKLLTKCTTYSTCQ